jgi:hypothetical protein
MGWRTCPPPQRAKRGQRAAARIPPSPGPPTNTRAPTPSGGSGTTPLGGGDRVGELVGFLLQAQAPRSLWASSPSLCLGVLGPGGSLPPGLGGVSDQRGTLPLMSASSIHQLPAAWVPVLAELEELAMPAPHLVGRVAHPTLLLSRWSAGGVEIWSSRQTPSSAELAVLEAAWLKHRVVLAVPAAVRGPEFWRRVDMVVRVLQRRRRARDLGRAPHHKRKSAVGGHRSLTFERPSGL